MAGGLVLALSRVEVGNPGLMEGRGHKHTKITSEKGAVAALYPKRPDKGYTDKWETKLIGRKRQYIIWMTRGSRSGSVVFRCNAAVK